MLSPYIDTHSRHMVKEPNGVTSDLSVSNFHIGQTRAGAEKNQVYGITAMIKEEETVNNPWSFAAAKY